MNVKPPRNIILNAHGLEARVDKKSIYLTWLVFWFVKACTLFNKMYLLSLFFSLYDYFETNKECKILKQKTQICILYLFHPKI